MSSVFARTSDVMEAKTTELYLYDYNQSDFTRVDEQKLLKQLQEEAELCSNNEHTEDEVTAAIGMMLMHYHAVSDARFTSGDKPIVPATTSEPINSGHGESTQDPDTNNSNGEHNRQVFMRRNRRRAFTSSSLLASCRNILKEFLAQNNMQRF